MNTKIDANDRKHTIFMASIVFSILFLPVLASPARAQGASSFIAESSLIDLVIEKQDYIEKYLTFNFTRINSTAWNMSWAFNETVRQMISNCRANSQCNYQQLKNQLIPEYDIPLGSFISDVALLDRMPVQALNDAKAHVAELNYLNSDGSFVAEFTEIGQKIKIGQRSVLIAAITTNVRDDSISYNSSGAFFATSLSTSGSGQIHKSTNNGSTWSLVNSGIGSTPIRSYIDSNNLLQIIVGNYHYSFNTSNSTLSPAHLLPSQCSKTTEWYPIPRRNGNISFIGQTSAGNALSLCEMNVSAGNINFIFYFDDKWSGGNQFAATETPDGFLHVFRAAASNRNWNYTNVSKTYMQSSTINFLTSRTFSTISTVSSLNGTVYATAIEIISISNQVLWFTRMNNNTKSFSAPRVIANYSDINITEAEIAVDSATDNIFIVFNNGTSSSPKSFCSVIYSINGGETWSPRINFSAERCFRPEPAGRYAWVNGLNSSKRAFLDVVFYNGSSGTTGDLRYESLPISPLSITDVIPVQVIRDVDLVKGKTILVRVNVTSSPFFSPQTSVTVKIFFDNQFRNSTSKIMNSNTEEKFNLFFVPNVTGMHNITATAEIEGQVMSSMTKGVNVVETRDLNVDVIPLFNPDISMSDIYENNQFLSKTYPVSDNGLKYSQEQGIFSTPILINNVYDILRFSYYLSRTTNLQNKFERQVFVLPQNWVSDNLGPFGNGWAPGFIPGMAGLGFVFVEEGFRHGFAHELGHTYGLCDEYNDTIWQDQDNFLFFTDLCPNGDSDNNGALDNSCTLDANAGCKTHTFKELIPWTSTGTDEINLRNFMGLKTQQNSRWISNDSYIHLLNEFQHFSPVNTSSRIMISGVYNKTNNNVTFDDFYTLESGLADNESELKGGNFSIEVYNQTNGLLINISFNLSFGINFIGGPTIEYNTSPFVFILPFNESVNKIQFRENGLLLKEVFRTQNIPSISITFPTGGEFFSNKMINATWNAFDSDSANLSYALLISYDNGSTFNSFAIDINKTGYEINTTSLNDCYLCRIKVLVTDGINTNSSVSNAFSMDNNLNITEFKVAYANNTQRIFNINLNNTADFLLSNISWILDTGNGIINSTTDFNINPKEEIFFYIYHNYSTAGSFNVTFNVTSNLLKESDTIQMV